LAAGLAAHPAESASHWLAASVPDRAFAAAVDAAGRAEAAHAPEDALASLELALALVDPASHAADPPTADPPTADPPATEHPSRSNQRRPATNAEARTEDGRARADAVREVATPLQMRAAESAFAAGRPARAVAYLEAILGSFDERRDRLALGLLHERLGRYRRAAGDRTGALAALERAVDLIPDEPT